MRITQYQSNFSTGEIDPLLRARTDLQQYQNALEEATNVVVQPQGGISRRDGLEFVFNFGSTFTAFKLIPFEFSVNDSYLLVFVVGRIYVFKNNVRQYVGTTGYITASDITAAMLDELEYTQAVDTLILCHEDLQTKRLVRNSDTSWTLENLPLTNPPQYAYALDEHSPNFTITPSATTGNITITASSVTTDTGTAQAGTANTITLKSASSYTSDDDPNGMWITLTGGTGAGQERYISDYVGSTKVATVYPAWTTQPDSSTNYKVAAFAASAANNFAQVENTFGRVKYISYVSDTIMNAVVEVPFFDTSGVVAGNWIGEFGYEDVWSSTRGWPRSATFHEGRLYFGGSKSRPNTVWGSRVIDYFNFDSHTGLDDEAVETTINTNQLNAIVNIVSGADLRIFSTGGEFIVVQSEDTPITPSNFLVRPQTRLGSKAGVPIEDLNGATIFVQRQGKAINAFQFGNDTRSYQVQNIALLSSHLLNDPVDIAVRRSSSTDEADRLFVVNNGDGSMAVYSILTGQNVIAPSKFTTDGEFIAVAVELTQVYSIVKRTVAPYLDIESIAISTYDGVSLDVSAQDSFPHGIFFKPDGTRLYTTGTSNDDIYEYSLSTAWDITTASYVQTLTSDYNPRDLFFKPDGTELYIVRSIPSFAYNLVEQHTLSTAWDISTSSSTQTFSIAAQDASAWGVFFKPDGTKMFVIGIQNDAIYEYALSTAWDISTASYTQNFSLTGQGYDNPVDLFFNADGTKMFILGAFNSASSTDSVYQYSLSTAWDVSTISYDGISFSVEAEDSSAQGLYFKDDNSKMYIAGGITGRIYQYSTKNIVYYLEAFNPDLTLDSAKTGGGITTVQLPHLRGETVNIIRDGISESAKTVSLDANQIIFEVENDSVPGTGFPSVLNLRATFTGTDSSGASLVEIVNFNDTNTTSWSTTGSFNSVSSIAISNTSGTPQAVSGFTINIGISGDNDAIFVNIPDTIGPTIDLNGVAVQDGVAAFGSITLDTAATSTHQVGLNYTVQAKTMPTEPTLSSGSIHGMKKRIVQVDALVDKTKDLKINGKTIAFDTESGSSVIAEYTGLKTAHGLLGYANTGQITLTQTDPLPMTVLGLEYKLSTGS